MKANLCTICKLNKILMNWVNDNNVWTVHIHSTAAYNCFVIVCLVSFSLCALLFVLFLFINSFCCYFRLISILIKGHVLACARACLSEKFPFQYYMFLMLLEDSSCLFVVDLHTLYEVEARQCHKNLSIYRI